MSYVFVYGTLKKEHGNNRLLDNKASEFVGPGFTLRDFLMVSPRSFPYVINPDRHDLSKNTLRPIAGEVYHIKDNELGDRVRQSLDWLEGYPRHYDRTEVEVMTADGNKVNAMMYFKAGGSFHEEECPVGKVNDTEVFYWQENPFE